MIEICRLVDFMSVETQLKFIEQGIVYDNLSEEDQQIYEDTFEDENGELPESIASSALNEWIFNEDTIREVLNIMMEHGLKIDYGAKIGKTIIFAKNHNHAEKILEVFNKEYPHLNGFAKVIDNYMTYAQIAIDEFSEAQKLPQIAISVDMLDNGVDVPEILNLVFFKKVMSKAKYSLAPTPFSLGWQFSLGQLARCPLPSVIPKRIPLRPQPAPP